jgi:hypothetical protein
VADNHTDPDHYVLVAKNWKFLKKNELGVSEILKKIMEGFLPVENIFAGSELMFMRSMGLSGRRS